MKSLYRTVPVLLFTLLVIAWTMMASAPAPAPTAAAENGAPGIEEALDCTQNGTVTVRNDFDLVSAVYVYAGHEETAVRTVPYGPFWTFSNPESYRRAGAELILTWELRRSLRGSACGNQIMAAANNSDAWYTQVRFVSPYQAFNGADLVQGYLIQKRVPLGNLQPSGLQGFQPPGMGPLGDNAYRMQFGVVYQAAPTYMTYQNPTDQTIVLAAGSQQGGGGTGGRDRPGTRDPDILRWTTPITAETLGQTPADYLNGKTISDIVNSRAVGRPDNQLCSTCHHSAASFKYRPPVATSGSRGITQEITPALLISREGERISYSWNGTTSSQPPIVDYFVQTPFGKPVELEAAFLKWLSDGGLE